MRHQNSDLRIKLLVRITEEKLQRFPDMMGCIEGDITEQVS